MGGGDSGAVRGFNAMLATLVGNMIVTVFFCDSILSSFWV